MPPVFPDTRQSLEVKLEVVNNADSFPTRRFTLSPPAYQVKIGRGSKSGSHDLLPGPSNTWFESRVMSRTHAILFAVPESKRVYIKDVDSMHGTFVEDRKLKPHGREGLFIGDIIKFGTEVTRGPESYPPLEVCITFKWLDDGFSLPYPDPTYRRAMPTRNTFSVPDDDDDDGGDVEIIGESAVAPPGDVRVSSRTFSVPDSVISCDGSVESDDGVREIQESNDIPSSGQYSNAIQDDNAAQCHVAKITTPQSVHVEETVDEANNIIRQSQGVKSPPQPHGSEAGGCSVEVTETVAQGASKATDDNDGTESEINSADGWTPSCIYELDSEDDDDDGEDPNSEEPDKSNHGQKQAGTQDSQPPTFESCLNTISVAPNPPPAMESPTLLGSQTVPSILPRPDARDSMHFSNQSLLSVGYSARPPSPSDAAMAKASQKMESAPFPPLSNPMRMDYGIASSYRDLSRPGLSFMDFGPYPQEDYPSDACYGGVIPSFSSLTSGPKSIDREYQFWCGSSPTTKMTDENNEQAQNFTDSPISTTLPQYYQPDACQPLPEKPASQLPTKLSIDDIVEKDAQTTLVRHTNNLLKRKANEMSSDEGGEDGLSEWSSMTGPPDVPRSPGKAADVQKPTLPAPDAIGTTIFAGTTTTVLPNDCQEPPRKRVRAAGNVAKYAAIMLAGVVLGGVGTVATLASLPTDFFL